MMHDTGTVTDCATCEPLLATYADDDIGTDDRARVEAHLRSCQACSMSVVVQQQVRAVLRARAMDLREPAPAALRDRVTRRESRARPISWRLPRSRAMPLSAAAALVIAIAGVLAIGALAPRNTLFAAQLALDHMKCLVLSRHQAGSTPAAAEANWEHTRGWPIRVPPADAGERLEFVALRRCLLTDGEVAHVLYVQRGHPVSLFIVPRAGQNASELAIMGYETVTWTAGDRSYAVVGELPKESLSRVAAYLRANVR